MASENSKMKKSKERTLISHTARAGLLSLGLFLLLIRQLFLYLLFGLLGALARLLHCFLKKGGKVKISESAYLRAWSSHLLLVVDSNAL